MTLFGKIKVSFLKASSDTVLLKGSGQIYYEKSPAGANRDTERSTDKREVSCSSTLLHLYFMNIICILLLTNSCGFQKLNSIFFSQISKLPHYRSCLRFTLFKSDHTYRQTFDGIILWLICATKLQIWTPMYWICKVVCLLKIFSYYITSIRGKFPLHTDCAR